METTTNDTKARKDLIEERLVSKTLGGKEIQVQM